MPDPDPLLEPFSELELEPVLVLSEEELLELELLLEVVLSSEPELEDELEPESEDPELLLPLEELPAVSEGEVLDPELESLEFPEEVPEDSLFELPLPGLGLELDGVVAPPLLSVLSAGGVIIFPEPSPGTNTTPGLPLFPGTPPVAVCWLPRKKKGNNRPFFLLPQ
ncbi:hypothetical protein LEP1GSC185_3643 [Leptospira licerasiae serovar Varillal str. VAR 010]|uniref:Uncharacterized protein n=1 Tax=Leptospira licerasiae str. MMD4847 TaxID=1049971 RepID=A0ABN0HE93_9LEPT|nr:hypothetical protein LEP1GSC185_3643 [Leptospira licerasiae serovar Varillal str. VAR 010]EJZ43908.1 hypothetical protein LEP1GSC178_2252 [Leptospira licerasiae str. MMD4847]